MYYQLMTYDDFDHSRCLDRATVLVDGEKFEVSSTILATRSHYFLQCFMEPSFVESKTRTVDLSQVDISREAFRYFLRRAYEPNTPLDGDSYHGLLKCGDYFASSSLLAEGEAFIIENCCPEKWQSNKKNPKKPFAIHLINGIELSFDFNLEKAKNHMLKMLGRLRFHTFLRDYPEVMQVREEIRLWIFDFYARKIMASQKS